MEKRIIVIGKYLNIPVWIGGEETLISIGCDGEKVYEFVLPIGNGEADYYAQIPVPEYSGKELFYTESIDIVCSDERIMSNEKRPKLHFTPANGWMNDPNGLIYDRGIYHLYFQYNPFDIKWGNMSWGHAVSTDLIHWEQVDSVMFSDKSGPIYSGCAIRNERGLLGLPKDALIFFYSAAGGVSKWSEGLEFTQKMAYSLDGGMTLQKVDQPVVPTIYFDSRDPKVFWHEESDAYIMVLWLTECDFGILRSKDLENWEMSDRVTLEGGWECPDLLYLSDDNGQKHWFFWAADGSYYPGEFDGHHFTQTENKKYAYASKNLYAAQTFSGISDRVISIPWIRFENDGSNYTGLQGIPAELSCKMTEEGWMIVQKPIREFDPYIEKISENEIRIVDDNIVEVFLEDGMRRDVFTLEKEGL